MQKNIEELLHKIYSLIINYNFHSPSLLSGDAGKALFIFHYEKHFNNEFSEFFSADIQRIGDTLNNVAGAGFCNGRAGTDWFFNFLFKHELIEKNDLDFFCSDPCKLAQVALKLSRNGNYDYLHGATGIAYYLLDNISFEDEIFFENFFANINSSISANKYFNTIAAYNFTNNETELLSVNLGFAHGIASVLQFCSTCFQRKICCDDARKISCNIINFFRQHVNKTEKSSFFSNTVYFNKYSETQSRLAWCYGDLIISITLLNAAHVFNDDDLAAFALNILHETAARKTFEQTNVYDACFCHGSAGIAYIFKKVFHKTGDVQFKHASEFWLNKTIAYLNAGETVQCKMYNAASHQYQENYSLLDGIAGTALVLYSFLTEDCDWDSCFMLNN